MRSPRCPFRPTMATRSVVSTGLPMPTSVLKPLHSSPGGIVGNDALHYALHSDPQSSHQQIAWLVGRIGRAPVLDVGAAQGFLGQMLQQDGVIIDAVEPHPLWAAHARPYYRTV